MNWRRNLWAIAALLLASPSFSTAQTWSLDPVLEIGAVDGEPHELFQFPVSAGRDGDRLFVADRLVGVVRYFAFDGSFLGEVGGEGEGPSEFQFLQSAWSHDGELTVADPVQSKLATFDNAGELVSTVRLPLAMASVVGIDRDGLTWVHSMNGVTDLTPIGMTRDQTRLVAFDRAGTEVRSFGVDWGTIRFDRSPHPFTPLGGPALLGGLVYVADPKEPRVRWYSASGQGSLSVGVPPPPTQAAAAELVRQRLSDDGNANLLQRLESIPLSGSTPAIARVMAAVDDELWVKRYDVLEDSHWLGGWAGGAGGEWLVVDRGGRTIATVGIPESVVPLAVDKEYLYARRRGEFDVQHVVVYRVVRNP